MKNPDDLVYFVVVRVTSWGMGFHCALLDERKKTRQKESNEF